MPPGRHSDQAAKIRAACRGLAVDADVFDRAWPEEGAAERFFEVALTDGRSLRVSVFMADEDQRWVIAEDVTEAKRHRQAIHASEIRSRESQRLESLSVLAGGIAHDFNNLLLVILTNAEILREESSLDPTALSAVSDIRLAAERASELSAKMLAYSGRGQMVSVNTDLAEIVTTVGDELLAGGEPGPTVELSCPAGTASVAGDPHQLRQLFKAVFLNALESSQAQRIEVSCRVDTWSPEDLSRLYLGDRLVSGPYVTVAIIDDGEGIDASALPRIFDPFFSTRGPSRGLGLAAAAGIARGHGGTIDVKSTKGSGAEVRVLLPIASTRPTFRIGPGDLDANDLRRNRAARR